MTNSEILKNAKIIWNFLQTGDDIEKADCIFTMGSNDLRVAERSAELYHLGYAELLVFSGGLGRFTKSNWDKPEAEKFAEIALKRGVPEEKIIKESNSTNSGENVLFTKELVNSLGLNLNSFILVQKPYMEKRALATFLKHWPDRKVSVTSPRLEFEAYPNEHIDEDMLIHTMVGDFQRLMVYPNLGYQVELPITQEALNAYQFLIDHDYTRQLV